MDRQITNKSNFHEIDGRSGAEAVERVKPVTLHSTHVTQGDTKHGSMASAGRPQMASPIAPIKAVNARQQSLQDS